MAEHLIFETGGQTLGVTVDCVREVVRAVALSPPVGHRNTVEGLLNLRGQVVPVIDLEQVLNLRMPPLSQSDYLVVLSDRNDRLCAVRACSQVQLTTDAELLDGSPAGQDDETNTPTTNQDVEQTEAAGSPASATAGYVRVGHLVVPLLDPEAFSNIAHSHAETATAAAKATDPVDAENDA